MHTVRFFSFLLIYLPGTDFSKKTCVRIKLHSNKVHGIKSFSWILAGAWKLSLFDFIVSFLFVVWKKKWSRVLFTKLFKQLTFVINTK